jgi:hypothetical protein
MSNFYDKYFEKQKLFAQSLAEKYPIFFGIARMPIEKGIPFNPIQLSIDVDAGWWKIVEEASAAIEKLNQETPNMEIQATQIKEKFGGLRIYTNYTTDEVEAIIEEAEKKAAVTCETCGGPGSLKGGSWLYTLCDECFAKRQTRTFDNIEEEITEIVQTAKEMFDPKDEDE